MNRFTEFVSALIMARLCPLCGKKGRLFHLQLICDECAAAEAELYEPVVLEKNGVTVSSFFVYDDIFALAMKNFKLEKDKRAGRYLSLRFAEEVLKSGIKADIVCCVPRFYRKKPGFNQTKMMARAVARRLGIRFRPYILRKKYYVRSQTMCDTPTERIKNVSGAFRVAEPARIKNKTVLLIDDICTTGATVSECERVLRKARCADVKIAAMMQADPDDEGLLGLQAEGKLVCERSDIAFNPGKTIRRFGPEAEYPYYED